MNTRHTIPLLAALLFALVGGFGAGHAFAEQPVFLVDELNGFERVGDVQWYESGNLYEYINGQAVYYFSYGFKKLEHAEYQGAEGKSFTVDVYELASPLSAFGAFRQQMDDEAEQLEVGTEGTVMEYLAMFYVGPYYVEIVPKGIEDEGVATLSEIALAVGGAIAAPAEIPAELSLFPEDGLIEGSERYVDENLLSYSAMGRGLTAEYDKGGDETFKVFIALAESPETALEVYNAYIEKLRSPEESSMEAASDGIVGVTPYRGLSMVYILDSYVFGALGLDEEAQGRAILDTVANTLAAE